eukprot:TRINITY_DN14649_c0_g1_i2.p1 TRINITY_DN14649_c0_g1~~TRINITY_DN14649_c0_g1_i2.p1  ORF type:complete len:124 (+),score=12.91 TRINITY_DN14649_c0_g1_i2:153-524(+)
MKSFANPEHFFKASYKKSQIKTPLINSMNNSSREKQLEVKELKFEASSNRQIKSNISFTTSKSAATIGLEAKSQDKNSGAIKESSSFVPIKLKTEDIGDNLSLIHICRCRRYAVCRSRWSPYH